jgi:hypothetical protein
MKEIDADARIVWKHAVGLADMSDLQLIPFECA